MLSIRDLTVAFGSTRAVDDVSLDLAAGEVLAVLGPSGSGKSTLLRAVAGLERPESGAITFDGQDLGDVPTHQRGFALMFQDGQLFPHRSVAGNVGYALRLRSTSRRHTHTRVAELLDLVGLPGYDERSPSTLSGGERQRVALARALAVEPRLLLLDEPLSALDRGLRDRLAGDLREILVAAGTTAMLVTHDAEEAFTVADTMAVMLGGRLMQAGTLDEVWRHPVSAQVARTLGYSTVLTGVAASVVLRAMALDSARDSTADLANGPAAAGPAIALRRSALRTGTADGDACLRGEVLSVKATPEATRLVVRIDMLGDLPAVADPASAIRVGQRVALTIDADRVALVKLPNVDVR